MSIEKRINKIISDHLGIEINEVTPDKKIVDDLGADYLDTFELVMILEDEFVIDIPDKDSDGFHNVGDYHECITKKIGDKNPSCFGKKLGVEDCNHGCPVSDECYKQ